MNLRDKLRGGTTEEAPADDAWSDADEAEEAPRAKSKAVPKAGASKAGGNLPKLDVNRRFLVLAGAAAFMTAIMGVMYLNNSASGLSEGGTKIEVVVLAEDVARGAKLTEDRLTTASIPKAYLPTGYFEVGEDNKGMEKAMKLVATAPMVAGEPLIEARVSPPDRKLGIAYLLKAGERAKTIKVDSASGLAGLIKPGNEVDLMANFNDPNSDTRRISTPVLQKARVIAVGDHLLGEIRTEEEEAQDESGGIESESTVTLAVSASKINLVALLEATGTLQVVLRAEGDDTIQKTAFTDEVIMALVSGRVPPKQPVVKHVPPRPAAYVPPRVVVREVVREAPPPRQKPVARPPRPVAAVKPPKPAPPKPAGGGNTLPQVIRFGGGETTYDE
jgi:pilus assembly protein CpaB